MNTLRAASAEWKRLWEKGKQQQQETQNNKTSKKKQRRKKRETTQQYIRRTYQQQNLYHANLDTDDAEAFGDIQEAKQEKSFRIGLQNINNLSEDKRTSKSRQLIDHIVSKQYDAFLMTEVGLCWRKMSIKDQWHERILGKFRTSRSMFAYNTTELEKTQVLQPGGVGMIATDDSAHRVMDRGKDPSGLGRYAWMRFQGRNSAKIRLVVGYRPCESKGPSTVNQQHQRYFSRHGKTISPRTAFYEDLYVECIQWMAEGDHLILAIDANEDVRSGETAEFARALGLKESILDRHSNKSPPATHNRNHQRQPIDGIFTSPGLTATAAGYGPFGSGCPSDHRFLWVDFSYTDVLGFDPDPIIPVEAKRLNTKDPRLLETYVTRVRTALVEMGLLKRAIAIEKEAKASGWSASLEQEYNLIQVEHMQIRKKIERNIRKLRKGAIPWSPKLQKFRTDIELWTMILRKRKGIKVSTKRIRRYMKRTKHGDALQVPVAQVEAALNAAHKRYKSAKSEASAWREDFLLGLAEAKAKVNGTTTEQEMKILQGVNAQKMQARNIKRMRKKLGKSATTKLWANVNGTRTECDDKDSMDRACMHENETRFSQSESCPTMNEPLIHDLGYLADTAAAEAILEGTYQIPDEVDPYTKLLIAELKMPDSMRNSKTSSWVPEAEHRQAWKTQKETISADPDSLSFSHYKAGASDDVICQFDAIMRSLPYEFGFSPEVWFPMTDVMILKKAGVYDVELMRTILLMNAEFNMNNKKLGRDMMRNAEAHNLLAREQYGSRKKHRSVIAALNKRLTMDLLRQQRKAGALCSNDAKSCYDRIVHNVAILAMRRLGVPPNPLNCMFHTLQNAAHKVRTAYGRSEASYGQDRAIPLQGIGQGNGCGPAGWAAISTPLINMMRSAGYGAQFLTAISVTAIAFVCYAFVDDTDVVHTGDSVYTSGEDIMQEMQSVVDHWEGGLRATGGALVHKKSYWYLIDFIWNENKGIWEYARIEDRPGDITIRDFDDERKVLQRLEVDIAKETLGVFLAMDGNNEEQTNQLRQKAEAYADCIRTGFISRNDATHALKSTIMKTLEYPMAATTMSKKQWRYIMAPILLASLPKMGFVRTLPRSLVFGPEDLCGLGIMEPWHNQHLTQLQVLLEEAEAPSITGDLIRASMEQMRLEVGLQGSPFQWPIQALTTLATDCWLKTLILYARENGLSWTDTLTDISNLRQHDQCLIDVFIQAGYQGAQLRKLNECRKMLEVTTVAEIATADGQSIDEWSWIGAENLNPFRMFNWPRHPPSLPRSYWNLWKEALSKSLLSQPVTGNKRLIKQLGLWDPKFRERWQWYYSATDTRVFQKFENQWKIYSQIPTRSYRLQSQRFLRTELVTDDLPHDSQPVSVRSREPNGIFRVQITGLGAFDNLVNDQVQQPTTMEDILLQRPQCDQWASSHHEVHDNGLAVAAGILQGTARAVSDGSFKNRKGTSASIIYGNTQSKANHIISVNHVPGRPEEQSAYRSELAGVSGSLAMIDGVCRLHDIQEGSITIGLDGDQALKAAAGQWPLHPGQADYDLLMDIRAKIKKLPIQVKWQWIKGHQDDSSERKNLDDWALSNIYVDHMAKAFWNHTTDQGTTAQPQAFGDEGWAIYLRGRKLGRIDKQAIYMDVYGKNTQQYWESKVRSTNEFIEDIDWKLIGTAFRSMTTSQKRRVIKHSSGHTPCGRMMKRWKFQDHSECPRCGSDNEDPVHIITCPHPSANITWHNSLTKLETWMTENHTLPEMRASILQRLRTWREPLSQFSPPIPDVFGLPVVIEKQDGIGWYNFLQGRLSGSWPAVQQAYYAFIGRRNTGERWAAALIKKVLEITWDLWDQRNDVLHNTLTPAKKRRMIELDATIIAEYSIGTTGLRGRDHHWFSRPVEDIKSYSVEMKLQWIESVRLARIRSEINNEEQQANLRAQREFMERWLH